MLAIYNYRSVFSFQDYYSYNYGYAETTESNTRYGLSISSGLMINVNLGPWIDVGVKYHNRSGDIVTDVGKIIPKEEISVNIGVVFFMKK